MDNKELLSAISELLDKKLKEELQPIKDGIQRLEAKVERLEARIDSLEAKVEQLEMRVDSLEITTARLDQRLTSVELHLKNVTDKNIALLAENYVPAAKRYEESSSQIEFMQTDIQLLKKVVTEHSQKLQMLA